MRFPKWFSHLIASRTTPSRMYRATCGIYGLRRQQASENKKRMGGKVAVRGMRVYMCRGSKLHRALYMMGDDRNNNKQHQRTDQNIRPYCGICRRSGVRTYTVGSIILETYLGISLENSIYSSILNARVNYATNVSCCAWCRAWKSNASKK